MNCPRCHDERLTEHDRSGITIDRCEGCRGIWLDRGELEKLLASARAEERRGRGDDHHAPRSHDQRRHVDRHDDDDDSGDRHPAVRRRSWWDILD